MRLLTPQQLIYFDYLKKWVGRVLFVLLCPFNIAQAESVSDAEVKAVYLYNFAHFIRWPDTHYNALAGQFVLCGFGADAVTSLLPQVVEGESLGNLSMAYRNISTPAEVARCHLLYLANNQTQCTGEMRAAVKQHTVLSVSGGKGFAKNGGHIELGVKNRRVHPIINRIAISQSQLQISAQLYRLSTIIEGSDGRSGAAR